MMSTGTCRLQTNSSRSNPLIREEETPLSGGEHLQSPSTERCLLKNVIIESNLCFVVI